MNRAGHYHEAARLAETAVEILATERTRLAALSPTAVVLNDFPLRIAALYLQAGAIHEGLAGVPDTVAHAAADLERRQSQLPSQVAAELATNPPQPGAIRPSPRLFAVTEGERR